MTSTTRPRVAGWAALGTTVAATALLIGCSTTAGGTPTTPTSTIGTTVTTTVLGTTTATTTATTGTTGTAGTDVPTVLTKIATTPPTPEDPGPPLQIIDDAELVAIAGQPGLIGWRGFSRITDDWTLDRYKESLTRPDGTAHPFVDAIDEVPDGKVLVVGPVRIGCDIPGGAALATDGSSFVLVPTDLPTEPVPECFVAVVTIAAVAVDPDVVPAGAVGPATDIYFSRIDREARDGAVELTDDPDALADLVPGDVPDLAPLADGLRRFAFVLAGCQDTAAAIEIDNDRIGARLDTQDPATVVACDAAEMFLAVFDVPESLVPETAELDG